MTSLNKARSPAYFPRQEEYIDQNGLEQIAAVQSVGFSDLMVIAQTPISRAQLARKELLRRSFFMGGAILFSVLFVALRFSNTIILPLASLSKAAGLISAGDFSARVEVPRNKSYFKLDEIGVMAQTFNLMAGKIGNLMIEAVEKTRMENELKTTQAFQKSFFPRKLFKEKQVEVYGDYVAASECAGDWWNYVHIGDQLIVAIGDVTGHGAGSALIAAVVHGAFSEIVFRHFKYYGAPPAIGEILIGLNRVMKDTTSSGTLMTFLLYSIDLKSGVLNIANASHPFPYLFRRKETGYAPTPLLFPPTNVLGYEETIEVRVKEIQLLPGDVLFSYSDGLFEQRGSDGAWYKKREMILKLNDELEDEKMGAEVIGERIIDSALGFFGRESRFIPDDITVVITKISSQGFGSA